MPMITKRNVDALLPGSVLWDDAVRGFGVRRQRRDAVYVLKHRNRWLTIGRHGSPWTPDTARKEAIRLLAEAVSEPVSAPAAAPAPPLIEVIETYLRAKTCRASSLREVDRFLRRNWAPLHDRPIDQISRRDVASLLATMTARRGARMALSAMFNWAIGEGYDLPANPVVGTNRPKAGERDRVLSDPELASVWRHSLRLGDYGRVVRLLMLTGQRRNEVAMMTAGELAGDLWTIPSARTKNHRQHVVPLTGPALAIVRDGLPFHVGSWMWNKSELDARVRLAPWVVHDLRRSVATGMANLGILPHVVEAVLNHVSGSRAGVAGIYNRARYADEIRDALSRWSAHISDLT